MALLLEIVGGDLKGTRTAVREGLIVGRKKGLLTIEDSKLSAKHAAVEKRSDGSYWMIDLGSANGIKIGSRRVRELALVAGAEFILGRTPFTVIDDPSVVEEPAIVEVAPQLTWSDHVKNLALRAVKESKVAKREIAPFSPPLHLKITRGLQAGTEWVLGYGPRLAGAASTDLFLDDPSLPGICFRLVPEYDQVRFVNEQAGEGETRVMLNGQWVETSLLKNGDVIEAKSVRLEVSFGAK